MRTAAETTEYYRRSRAKYDQFCLERAARLARKGTVDHTTRDFGIDVTPTGNRSEFHFTNGKEDPPKFDWRKEENRSRLEAAVIRMKGVSRRLDTLEEYADARPRSGATSSNTGPTASHYGEPNQNGGRNPYESAGRQAAVSMRPDLSAGAQAKKTQEHPTGDAAKCSCGQPRGKCSCDNRIARSAVMDIKPSATIVPFATINKTLVAAETSAMSAMKKTIAQGLKSRGY